MPARSDKPRKQLLAVTAKLLETRNPESLTVREISAEAGFAPGQINYHFGSRDALIHEAVGERLRTLASSILEQADQHGSPREVLRHLLREGSRFSMTHAPLVETIVKRGLTTGELAEMRLLEPLVVDILGAESVAARQKARLLTFQLFTIVQAAFLNRGELQRYSGFDFADDAQRDAFLDGLLETFLPRHTGAA